MIKIIGIGDNVVDKYIDMGKMYPGGNALNIAVLSNRYGAETAYLGCLGNDYAGGHIYESLKEEGVDVSRIRLVNGENAYANVTLVDGDRIFMGGSKGVSQDVLLDEADLAFINTYDLIHTSIYSRIESQLPILKETNVKISFDYSNDYTQEHLDMSLPFVNYAFFSGSGKKDEEIIEFAEKIQSYGPELVLVTRGSKGAFLWYQNKFYAQDIVSIEVVDTLGAGDGFISRLLVGILRHEDIKEILYQSAVEAATVCTYYGAFGHGVDF